MKNELRKNESIECAIALINTIDITTDYYVVRNMDGESIFRVPVLYAMTCEITDDDGHCDPYVCIRFTNVGDSA